jgi:hypothetical protein
MATKKSSKSQQPPVRVDTEPLLEQQKNLQRDAFSASFSMIRDIDKLGLDQPQKTFDIGNLADVSKSVLQERQQNLPRIQPPIQRAEIAQTVDLGQGLEEAVEQQKNETIQKTFLSTAEEKPVGQPIPWEEKYGVKTFFTKSAGDITSLLQQRICNVEFTRVTSPQGKRVLRCTLNPNYIPSRISGLGNYGGLITVWDVELNDYRSFYSTSVHKISYDENPGRRG